MTIIYVVSIVSNDYWSTATFASTSKADAEEYAAAHGGDVTKLELVEGKEEVM